MRQTQVYKITTDGKQIEEDKQIYLPLCYSHFISSNKNGLVTTTTDKELD